MTKGLVTCKKCGKTFNYDTHDGVCPKCCRYYSLTKYNEEEALLANILDPANEENCSYHGGHDRSSGLSGHSEDIHKTENRQYVNRTNNMPVRTNKSTSAQAANKKAKGFLIILLIYIVFGILSAIISAID